MRRIKIPGSLLILLFIFQTITFADTVFLKNGQELEGVIQEESEAGITIDFGYGKMNFDSEEIERVVRADEAQNADLLDGLAGSGTHSKELKAVELQLAEFQNKRILLNRVKSEYKSLSQKTAAAEESLRVFYADLEELNEKYNKAYIPNQPLTLQKRKVVYQYRERIDEAKVTIRQKELEIQKMKADSNALDGKFSQALKNWLGAGEKLEKVYQKSLKENAELSDLPQMKKAAEFIQSFKDQWEAQKIPLRQSGQSYIVNVRLNGQEIVPMILDTGASSVTISSEVAELLGIQPGVWGSAVTIVLANGSKIEGRQITLNSIEIGGARVDQVPAIIIHDAPGQSVKGLLGMSFLKHFFFKIDTKEKSLILEKLN